MAAGREDIFTRPSPNLEVVLTVLPSWTTAIDFLVLYVVVMRYRQMKVLQLTSMVPQSFPK
jgi:hypothetical protein